MKTMASIPQWMVLICLTIALMCLTTTTNGASLYKKAQLLDSTEDLPEPVQIKSKPHHKRKVAPKRDAPVKAPILLENDDEHFQLTVEDYDDRKMDVHKFVVKRQHLKRVRRAATLKDDGSGEVDADDVYTTAQPEEDGSGAVFGEDLKTVAEVVTTVAEEVTTEEEVKTEAPLKEVVEEIIIPENVANVAAVAPKVAAVKPEEEAVLEIETTMTYDNDTTIGDPMGNSSMRMAIIIAAIVGFWVLLAPVICIICKYRDRKNDKLNQKNKNISNNVLTPKSDKPVTNGDVPDKYTKIDPDTKEPEKDDKDIWENRQLNGNNSQNSQATRV